MLKARKKIQKKELKKDPFFEKIDQGVRLYNEKKSTIYTVAAGILVVILALYAFNYMSASKETAAAGKFGIAQQYIEANMTDKALSAFNEIRSLYSGTQYAELSNYYIGYIFLNQMDYTEAKPYLEMYLNKNDKNKMFVESALVGLAVIESANDNYESSGDYYTKAADMSKTKLNQINNLMKSARQFIKAEKAEKVAAIIEKLDAIDDLTQSSKDQLDALKLEFELLAK